MISEKEIIGLRKKHVSQVEDWAKDSDFRDAYNDVDIEYRLASQLQAHRKKHRLSQKDIAERMHTTQSVVSRIERGTNISLETLARYTKACGLNLEIRVS